MRRKALSLLAALVLAGATATMAASPAQADPCGASSWIDNGFQHVGYRNCGGSLIYVKGHIDNSWGDCESIGGYGSEIIQARYTYGEMEAWGVTTCSP